MTRIGYLLLLLGLSSTGCVHQAPNLEAESRQYPPVRMTAAPPSPQVVTADQVNESNASDAAQALNREMDYETRSQPRAMPMTTTMANPMKP